MPKVIIVDDDRTTVSLLQTLLEMDDFQVAVVPRGAMVLERSRQERPDVFLIDYHLSDMHGTDVVRQLRASPEFARAPIVLASGLNVEDEARAAGATLFLIKPFEPGQLSDLLNQLIKQR